jgi:hypothetical protein
MADTGITLFRPDDLQEDGEIARRERGIDRVVPAGLDEEPIGSPEETAEIQRLEAEIAVKRERVVASFSELRRRMVRATDWRGWVRKHPVAWIAGAVTVGFVLGYRGGGRSSRN